jgi:putative hydrolase of the HAD superfamily
MSLEFEQAYWGSFLSAVELREGVLNFLDMLTRANIPKVIVTDLTTAIQLRKLVYLELDRHFEYVVTSEESGADKPDRAGFDLAMSKLSMTGGPDRLDEPEASENSEHSVWMIGDNMTSDIQGAKKAINATTLTLKSEIGNQGGHEALDMDFDTFNDLERFFVEAGWDTPVR